MALAGKPLDVAVLGAGGTIASAIVRDEELREIEPLSGGGVVEFAELERRGCQFTFEVTEPAVAP
jgi:hypothetical protein